MPYREPRPSDTSRNDRADASDAAADDRVVYVALASIGAIPPAIAVARGEAFGAASSIGAAMVIAGIIGVLASLRRRA